MSAEGPAIIASLVAAGLQEALASDVALVAIKRREALRDVLLSDVPHHPKLESLRT